MKRNSKALCLLLAGAMTVSNCPVSVQAAETENKTPEVVSEGIVEVKEKDGETAAETTEETVQGEIVEEEKQNQQEEVKETTQEEIVKEVLQEETIQKETAGETGEAAEVAVETASVTDIVSGEETTEEEITEEEINADTSLTIGDFTYTEGTDGITIKKYSGTDSTVDITKTFAGETVVAIGNSAFSNNDYLSEVILPNTIKSIGNSAFQSCDTLAKVTISGGESNLESIGESAFSNCNILSVFPFVEGLKSIGTYGFYGTALTEVNLPEGFAGISAGTFKNCDALSKVTFPSTLNSIGKYAFKNCDALQKIIIPEACTTISQEAFYSCGALSVVEFQSNTVVIYDSAFPNKSDKLVFYGEPGSTAETTAANIGVRFNRYTDSITIKNLPTKVEYLYGEDLNTTGLTIEVDYTSDTEPVTEEVGADVCNFSGYNKNKVGKQTITVSYAGKETTFDVNVYYDLSSATIDSISDQTYTGSALTPEVTVTGKETKLTLVKDKDYTVEYLEDHINVGTATVRIIGMGDYKGTKTKSYKIVAKSLNAKEISASVPTVTYNGEAQKPAPILQDGTVTLTTEDYSVGSYSSNTNAGTGTVRIEGKGNYTGIIYVEFTIEPQDITEFKVEDIPDQIYTGYSLTPEIVIPLDEYSNLVKGTDYTVRYKENTEIGTAKVSIEGKGNYTGTIEKTFAIKAKSLKDITIDAIEDQTYTGKAIEPSVYVYDSNYGETLIQGTDYTVTYKDNTNAGTATITIEGIGSYEGTIEKTFIIKSKKLTGGETTISNVDSCVYSGKEQKPSFKVTLDDEITLVENKDYTVSYKDNVEAGTGIIVIEGMGNYKGTVEKTFTIRQRKLDGITVNDLPGYTYTGEAIKPAIDVKMEGVSLTENKDYKISYSNNVNAGVATVYIEGMGNYEGTVNRTFDIKRKSIADIGIRNIPDHIYTGSGLEPTVSLELDVYTTLTKGIDYEVTYQNNVNVGTATIQVQGIGNYIGTIEKTFKITPKSLADASLVVSESVSSYTGQAKTPAVSVVSGNKTLTGNTEYTVKYRNNKNIGTATVTVTGIGNYTGSVSKNFTIQAKKGSTFTVGAYKYKVTSASEVAFAGLKNSKTKKVTIPAQVKIGGKKFKVTSIANKALKGKSVTSVTIGKNVKNIGTSAFEKCGKLTKITVKGTVLKKVGKNALKGINGKAKIKVPKSKLSAYKKLMKNKGQSKTVKITK